MSITTNTKEEIKEGSTCKDFLPQIGVKSALTLPSDHLASLLSPLFSLSFSPHLSSSYSLQHFLLILFLLFKRVNYPFGLALSFLFLPCFRWLALSLLFQCLTSGEGLLVFPFLVCSCLVCFLSINLWCIHFLK